MKSMKKFLVGLLVATAAIVAQAQQIMRAEISPGVYGNVGMDANGAIFTSGSTTGGTGPATGTGAGQPVSFSTKISTANSTTANLAPGAIFTGTSEEVINFAEIRVSVFSSHASATDGLSLQQSNDGTNWDNTDVYSIPAVTGKSFGVGVGARYFRLVYTNGVTLTTSLRIQTTLHYVRTKPSAVRPQDARPNDNDFEEQLGYQMVYNGSSWDRLRGDINAGQWVQLRASATGGYSYNRMNTVVSPTIKSGAGTIHAVTVGSTGTTSSLTCYDSLTAAGAVIFVINTTTTGGNPFIYDAAFTTGLTCANAGSTPADLTITYK